MGVKSRMMQGPGVLLLLAMLSCGAQASGLVGPGAMTPYSGGGGGRQRSYGYVREPAKGFFISGSSIPQLNGIYDRVESFPRAINRQLALAYVEERSRWI